MPHHRVNLVCYYIQHLRLPLFLFDEHSCLTAVFPNLRVFPYHYAFFQVNFQLPQYHHDNSYSHQRLTRLCFCDSKFINIALLIHSLLISRYHTTTAIVFAFRVPRDSLRQADMSHAASFPAVSIFQTATPFFLSFWLFQPDSQRHGLQSSLLPIS